VVVTTVVKLSARAAFKLAKVAKKSPKLLKAGKVVVKFVKGRPRAAVMARERGEGPVGEALSIFVFQSVARPILRRGGLDVPSITEVAADFAKSIESGDFEIASLETSSLLVAGLAGPAVLAQILFETSEKTTGAPRLGLKLAVFLL